jgi:hypothetical protein
MRKLMVFAALLLAASCQGQHAQAQATAPVAPPIVGCPAGYVYVASNNTCVPQTPPVVVAPPPPPVVVEPYEHPYWGSPYWHHPWGRP